MRPQAPFSDRFGRRRRAPGAAKGFPEALVFREYYIPRQALWGYIREAWNDRPIVFKAIARLDIALSVATRAALRGFHRPSFEEQGRWPECIEDLARDWRELPEMD